MDNFDKAVEQVRMYWIGNLFADLVADYLHIEGSKELVTHIDSNSENEADWSLLSDKQLESIKKYHSSLFTKWKEYNIKRFTLIAEIDEVMTKLTNDKPTNK